ncbi:MAG TPA: hypothetical protein PK539_02920 [Candidatus Paceibacterota bacterium]|nr:hypothetical protein [Candidatus Paceibacterota bacterium]
MANVLNYKHLELLERYKRKLSLSQADAEELFSDVKRYLCLVVATGERLSPTRAIDAGWHEFLMYTRDYANFCTRYFGAFVHHAPDPVFMPRFVVSDATATVACASDVFGELGKNWTARAAGDCSADCSPDSDCHGDGSCGGDV